MCLLSAASFQLPSRGISGVLQTTTIFRSLEEARRQRCSENPEEAVIVAPVLGVGALANSARLTSLHCVSKLQEGLKSIHDDFLGLL